MKKQMSLQGRVSLGGIRGGGFNEPLFDEPLKKRAKIVKPEPLVKTKSVFDISKENLFPEAFKEAGIFCSKEELQGNRVRFYVKLPYSLIKQLTTFEHMVEGILSKDEIKDASDLFMKIEVDQTSIESQFYTQLLKFLERVSYKDLSRKEQFEAKIETLLKESIEKEHDFIEDFQKVSGYFGLDLPFKVTAFVDFSKEKDRITVRIHSLNSTLIEDTRLDDTRNNILIKLFKVDLHVDRGVFQQKEIAELMPFLNEISQKQFYFNFKNIHLPEIQKLMDFLNQEDKPLVRELNLEDAKLAPGDLGVLTEAIQEMPHLESLNLSGVRIESELLSALPPSLKALNVAGTSLNPANLIALRHQISQMPHLESLNLSGVNIDHQLISVLPLSLRSLNVAGTSLNPADLTALKDRISQMPHLESLNLSGVRIESELLSALPPSLKALNVAGTRLNPADLTVLKERISQMPHLESLNMAENDLRSSAAEPLIDALGQKQGLRYLNLTYTPLSAAAIQRLQQVLPTLPFLESLILIGVIPLVGAFNQANSSFIQSLSGLQALRHLNISTIASFTNVPNLNPSMLLAMPKLDALDISHNDGFFKNENQTIDQLAQLVSLKKLKINFNNLNTNQIDAFLNVLPFLGQLEELDMVGNTLTDTQATALLKILVSISNFKHLNAGISQPVLASLQEKIAHLTIEKDFDVHRVIETARAELPMLSDSLQPSEAL